MSKMKKLVAVLLTAVMVMAMGMTAFAAGSTTITVKNTKDADSVEYLQIVAPDQTTVTGWTFVNGAGSAFTTALNVADEQTALWMLIKYQDMLDGVQDPNIKYPAGINNTTATAIDRALSTVSTLGGYKNTPITVSGDDHVISDITSAGMYAIKVEEEGYTYKTMAAYVGFGAVQDETYPTVQPAEVIAKKSSTKLVKNGIDVNGADDNDNNEVVGIGDIVQYTVETYVPFIDPAAFETTPAPSFMISDEIFGAEYYLTGDGAVSSVLMEGSDEQQGNIVVTRNTFNIDLSSLLNATNTNAGKKITVTYTAKVTEEIVNNTAGSHVNGVLVDQDKENFISGQIALTKYAEDGVTTLEGAGFKVIMNNQKMYLSFRELGDGVYEYDPEGTVQEIFTNEDGILVVKGLDVGKYHFEESTAPEGYSINTDGTTAVVIKENDEDKDTEIIEVSTSLTDTKLSALPSTGGIGTTIFTIGGCLIMIAAAAMFFASRKRSER